MLELEQVDLSSLAEALQDHSGDGSWWFDPATGQVEPYPAFDLKTQEEDEIEAPGLVRIDPLPSSDSYRDMEDFAARVRDPRARDLLRRAIAGRGAFRRFKDTLFEFPELREAWFRFHDARMERRGIEWLAAEGLIDPRTADRALLEREDPDLPEPSGSFDPAEIVKDVARDLQALYGDRLRTVLLFGSWARGDAHPESDVDLLVVLDRVDSPWDELRRMDGLLWRHSLGNDTVVSALPVSEADLREARSPTVIRARAEGRAVA